MLNANSKITNYYTPKERNLPMPLVKVRKSNQVTIPKKFVEELGIKEGDYVELSRKGNKLYIAKKNLASIFREKAKHMETSKLSKEGKRMVAEALEDIEQGRFKEFDNIEDLIADLKK